MAMIKNLGAAYSKQIAQQRVADDNQSRPKRSGDTGSGKIPFARRPTESRRSEEAQISRGSTDQHGQARKTKVEHKQPMSLDELAEVLRRVNLTFDLFEIQTSYTVDSKTGDITVEVVNQRTGKVIRRIPPYDVPDFVDALNNGEALLTDVLV